MNFAISHLALPIRVQLSAPMSDDELISFSEQNSPLQVEREPNGDLWIMTPTGTKTSMINNRVSSMLTVWAESDRKGMVTDADGGFSLPDGSVRAPDAAWISRTKWEALTERQQEGFASVCPEFVIEIQSPSDRAPDARAKLKRTWLPNGVELGWLLDPKSRTVTIYRQGEAPETLVDPSSVQGSGPVAGFELVLSRVW